MSKKKDVFDMWNTFKYGLKAEDLRLISCGCSDSGLKYAATVCRVDDPVQYIFNVTKHADGVVIEITKRVKGNRIHDFKMEVVVIDNKDIYRICKQIANDYDNQVKSTASAPTIELTREFAEFLCESDSFCHKHGFGITNFTFSCLLFIFSISFFKCQTC